MKKTKIIDSGTVSDLENEINKFLKQNDMYELLDIKFSSSTHFDVRADRSIFDYSALLIFDITIKQ